MRESNWLTWRHLVEAATREAFGDDCLIVETAGTCRMYGARHDKLHVHGEVLVRRAPADSDYITGDFVVARWDYYPGDANPVVRVHTGSYGLSLMEAATRMIARLRDNGVPLPGTLT